MLPKPCQQTVQPSIKAAGAGFERAGDLDMARQVAQEMRLAGKHVPPVTSPTHQQRLPPPRPYAPEQAHLVRCMGGLSSGRCCPPVQQPRLLLPGLLSRWHTSVAAPTRCPEEQEAKAPHSLPSLHAAAQPNVSGMYAQTPPARDASLLLQTGARHPRGAQARSGPALCTAPPCAAAARLRARPRWAPPASSCPSRRCTPLARRCRVLPYLLLHLVSRFAIERSCHLGTGKPGLM